MHLGEHPLGHESVANVLNPFKPLELFDPHFMPSCLLKLLNLNVEFISLGRDWLWHFSDISVFVGNEKRAVCHLD